MSWGEGWKAIYRTALVAERKAAKEIREREERRARMKSMMSGKGGRR